MNSTVYFFVFCLIFLFFFSYKELYEEKYTLQNKKNYIKY